MKTLRSRLTLLLIVTFALGQLVGCSDSTAPDSTPFDGGATFDGSLDPQGGTFILQRVETPVPGQEPVRVDLIGSNLRVDSRQETVTLDVAIRSAWHRPLYAPGMIWVSHFRPATVTIQNADATQDTATTPSIPPRPPAYGFDYSELLGDDGVLEPGETSQSKPWVFHDPGLVAFSFAVQATFSLGPDSPHITGVLFTDSNRNGVQDPDEPPFLPAMVHMLQPDGTTRRTSPAEDGTYRLPIDDVGFHRLTFFATIRCPGRCTVCVTTPNPLEVMILPGPDGRPQSFHGADFGAVIGPCVDPIPDVIVTRQSPGDIDQDPYSLLDAQLDGHMFRMRVGFSGCSPDHPLVLYAGRNWMESYPIATWMLLAHDDLGEMCDAWWERTLAFDLEPILQAYIEDFGAPDRIRLLFHDSQGQVREFLLQP